MIAIVAIVIFYLYSGSIKRSSEDTLVDIDFSKIDDMEGHRFEYFIAKVLRKTGSKMLMSQKRAETTELI